MKKKKIGNYFVTIKKDDSFDLDSYTLRVFCFVKNQYHEIHFSDIVKAVECFDKINEGNVEILLTTGDF